MQVNELNLSADFSNKTESERLNDREEQRIRPETMGKTLRDVLAHRRSEDLDYNTRTFGVRAIGVHGFELPKFAEHQQQYWKKPDPQEPSWRKLRQIRKLG